MRFIFQCVSFKPKPNLILFKISWKYAVRRVRSKLQVFDIQGGPKSKPLPTDQKIVLNRVKTCEWDKIYSLT